MRLIVTTKNLKNFINNKMETNKQILRLQTEAKIDKTTIKALKRDLENKENAIKALNKEISKLDKENGELRYFINELKCGSIIKYFNMN